MIPLLVALVLGAQDEKGDTWTVVDGDTCSDIARAVWGDGARITELHKWNQLGPLPHNLRAGMVLRLRAAPIEKETGPDATLTFLKPSVRARHLVDWQPALLGMGLFRLDEVNTLKGAGAALRLRDSSSLVLDENALVVVYGASPPQRIGDDSGVTLVDGELRLALARMRASPLAINTPGVALTGSGLKGVVAVDGEQATRVSVFEGTSLVRAHGVTVTVSQHQGTRVRLGRPPEPPRPLPDAPLLEAVDAVVVAGPDGMSSLSLRWKAAARAEQYRVQVARDDDFVDRLRDAWTTGLSANLDRLEAGPIHLRVISFDDIGLQSQPSEPLTVELVEIAHGDDTQGDLLLSTGAKLTFKLPAACRLLIDGAQVDAERPWPVGVHALSVVDPSGKVVLERRLVVPPAPPRLVAQGDVLRALFTEDLPLDLPLVLEPGGPFSHRSAREWEIARPAPGPATVRWLGRPLSRVHVGANAPGGAGPRDGG